MSSFGIKFCFLSNIWMINQMWSIGTTVYTVSVGQQCVIWINFLPGSQSDRNVEICVPPSESRRSCRHPFYWVAPMTVELCCEFCCGLLALQPGRSVGWPLFQDRLSMNVDSWHLPIIQDFVITAVIERIRAEFSNNIQLGLMTTLFIHYFHISFNTSPTFQLRRVLNSIRKQIQGGRNSNRLDRNDPGTGGRGKKKAESQSKNSSKSGIETE
jgi:hypothetical protein